MDRETLLRFLGAVLVLVGSVLLQNTVQASETTRGTWTAKWQEQRQELNLQMNQAAKHSNFGQSYKLAELRGLTADIITGAKSPVRFQLVRDAGTLAFDGSFNRGLGAGEFTFTGSPEYVTAMKALGYSGTERKLFELAALDVSRAYAEEFKALGFATELDDLIEGRIFNVNRAQVEELRALGYTTVPLKKLVELRIFEVDGAYIRNMRAQGMDLSLDKLVETQIFKATPEFRKELADLGYPDLAQDDLIAFKIHDVTPEFIREMRELGFKDLSAKQLQEFRIFGVGPQQLADLKSVGYTDLDASDLVAFKIHGVDSGFIKKAQRYGYKHPTPDQLVEMKIMGIRVREQETF